MSLSWRTIRFVVLIALLCSCTAIQAQPVLTWGSAGLGGVGTWNVANTNWFNGSIDVPWANGSSAQFNDTAGTVTVSANTLSAASLTFSHTSGNYALVQTGTNALTLTGTGTVTQNNAANPVRIGTWVTNSVGTAVLTGTNGFTKEGAGEVILASQLNTTGGIVINGGILTFGDRTQPTGSSVNIIAGNSIANGNNITINNGGTLRLAASSAANTTFTAGGVPQITLNGNTTISGWRTATSSSHPVVFAGNLVVGNSGATLNSVAQGNSNFTSVANNRLSINGSVTLNGNFTVKTQPFITGTSGSNVTLGAVTDNGNSMTFFGGGTATVISGDSIRLNTASTMTGNWTVGNTAGTEGVTLSMGSATSTTTMTTGTITVNPYSSLLYFTIGAYGTPGQNININGIGAQLADFSAGNAGAIRTGYTTGTASIASNVVMQSDSTVGVSNAAAVLQLTGPVSGGFNITKQGPGTLALGGVNTYGGNTVINQGTLQLSTGNDRLPTGTTVNMGQASSTNVGTLDLNGQNQTVAGLNSITGTNVSSNRNTVTSASAATLTLGGSGSYTFSDGSSQTSGNITGALSVSKTGSGFQALGGTNTYTGTTSISNGALAVNGSHTGGGAYTVTSPGILQGSGNIVAPVNITTGTLSPGNSAGTLTIAGDVTFSSTATFSVDLNGNTPGGGGYDQLVVTGFPRTTALGGATLSPTLTYAPAPTDLLYIINNFDPGAVLTGTFAGLAANPSPITIGSYTGFVSYTGDFDGLTTTGGNDVVIYGLTLAAVPEPGTIALMGLVGFGTLQWYLRRKPKVEAKVDETTTTEETPAVA